MRNVWCAALLCLTGCDALIRSPPKPQPEDPCVGLAELTLSAVPPTVRVNGSAALSTTGGSGRVTYTLEGETPVGKLVGDRYVASLRLGTDTVIAQDDCGNEVRLELPVSAAFEVEPTRAVVQPGASFPIRVKGLVGTPEFRVQGSALASGGQLTPAGNEANYVAGPTPASDVIVVRDSSTGDEAAIVITVSVQARFRAASERLALPTGASIPLQTLDGTGVVSWRIAQGTGGSIEQRAEGTVFLAPDAGGGTFTLEAQDVLLDAGTTVRVRVLTELSRPGLVAQGRRSDTGTLVTGDFDGDGRQDVAVGIPESDLARPQGGAVFLFMGTASGLPAKPTWQIPGTTDTAQFGAVMAAGDLNGDGRDDLAISAPGDDLTVSDSGAVYLYTVSATGPRLLRPPLTGLGRGNFGAALAIADIDGDEDNDLIVGSPGADLAPGGAFSARGVIDLFRLQKGQPIPDLGSLRLGGSDLDPDGGFRRASNLRAGRALVAADLNGDGRVDLAFLTSVNNTFTSDGGTLSRNVIAAQVHFGRASMTKPFEDLPDVFVTPANTSDGDEGTWRLGFIPKEGARPALLVTAADRTDAPDLRAGDAGTAGGSNAGGTLLFDLTGQSGGSAFPPQIARLQAWARVYGSQSGIQASRSFAALDVDGDGTRELVLGAPYASRVDGGVTLANTGRLEIFDLGTMTAGTIANRPSRMRAGLSRTDVMGTAIAGWESQLVVLNGRSSTDAGDFVGRLDVLSPAPGDPALWGVNSFDLPAKPGGQQFGATLDLGVLEGKLSVVVGVPNWNGPAGDNSGNEALAGRALTYVGSAPDVPLVLAEGAATPYLTDAGVRAFGGRGLAPDVTVLDFDGDLRLDMAVAAPNFTTPTRGNDGGISTTEYALNRQECSVAGSQSPGGLLVYLGQADGTYREGFRLWGMRDIAGCVVPDGGAAAICQRSTLGRAGITGGFDFNGDGKDDLAATRSNGLEIFLGRAPDDAQLTKPSMGCDPVFSLPFLSPATSIPTALGDLDGDGCHELGLRYSDNTNRQGVVVLYGYDATGTHCMGNATASWLRISGDTETGIATMRLGIAMARATDVLATHVDTVAVTADLYPFRGTTQPAVLLLPTSQLAALRPSAPGEKLVSLWGDGLVPIPLVPRTRALNFGRSLAGNVDVDGDGQKDLVVGAPGASVNGDGTGAVLVFKGGTVVDGVNDPTLVIVSDQRERASFGQDLAISPSKSGVPATLGIGAPLSYRSGTANGTAYVLPLDF